MRIKIEMVPRPSLAVDVQHVQPLRTLLSDAKDPLKEPTETFEMLTHDEASRLIASYLGCSQWQGSRILAGDAPVGKPTRYGHREIMFDRKKLADWLKHHKSALSDWIDEIAFKRQKETAGEHKDAVRPLRKGPKTSNAPGHDSIGVLPSYVDDVSDDADEAPAKQLRACDFVIERGV
jgi:hypothetical protein